MEFILKFCRFPKDCLIRNSRLSHGFSVLWKSESIEVFFLLKLIPIEAFFQKSHYKNFQNTFSTNCRHSPPFLQPSLPCHIDRENLVLLLQAVLLLSNQIHISRFKFETVRIKAFPAVSTSKFSHFYIRLFFSTLSSSKTTKF